MAEEIIPDSKALLLKDDGEVLLIVADLHFKDSEEEYVNKTIKELNKLVKEYKPDLLVINGDVFDFGTGGEKVDYFINEMTKSVNVIVLQGNHDPSVFPPYYLTKNYCISHGDYDYKTEKKNLILAHTHPLLDDKKVFVKGELKDKRKFIILPAYKDKVHGADVKEQSVTLGFIFTQELIKKGVIYDLKGRKVARVKFNK